MTRVLFTLEMQKQIAARIDDVPAQEVVTWARVEGLAAEVGVNLTRQWLCKSLIVAAAYRRHSEAIKLSRSKADGATKELSEAPALKEEVTRLEGLLAESDKRFLRWLHNATQMGVTIEQLETPIPELEV